MAPKTSLSIRNKLVSSFFLSLFAFLLFPALHINIKLLFFIPFLVEVMLITTLSTCLWLAALTGFFLDLLSSAPFGINILNYTLCCALLFRFRQFFNVKIHSLASYSFVFAVLFNIFYPFFLYILGKRLSLHLGWVFTDVLIMPLLDALYAATCVFLPQIGIQFLYKKTILFLISKRWIKAKRR